MTCMGSQIAITVICTRVLENRTYRAGPMQIIAIIEECSGIRFWNLPVPHTFLYVREFRSCYCCIKNSSLEGDADLLTKSVPHN